MPKQFFSITVAAGLAAVISTGSRCPAVEPAATAPVPSGFEAILNSLLPEVCGRVWPQEVQCQEHCTVGKSLKSVDKAVSIGRVERYVADLERESGKTVPFVVKPATGKKVAVIGSGPASVTVANAAVTRFQLMLEASASETGGWLMARAVMIQPEPL